MMASVIHKPRLDGGSGALRSMRSSLSRWAESFIEGLCGGKGQCDHSGRAGNVPEGTLVR